MGIFISLFSYLSIEMIAVSAGEAENPRKAVPIALKSAVIRLILFYIVTLVLMLMIVPWGMAGADKSPFVKVMEILNIPGGASMMNFVVLIAALSAMNSQLYISTRMMFSLSRGGFARSNWVSLTKDKFRRGHCSHLLSVLSLLQHFRFSSQNQLYRL